MKRRRIVGTLAGRPHTRGVRVSAGAWTACGSPAPAGGARLIVALGRTAGGATTRSRIRRIAREIFADGLGHTGGVDLLLLARNDVSSQPRRQVRARLSELLTRLSGALARRQAEQTTHG